MFASGSALPTTMSEPTPDCTVMPTRRRFGARIVALLAVEVVDQRDVGGPVRVVLDRGDLGGDPVLRALEVDLAVQALGPAATAVAAVLRPCALRPPDFLRPSVRRFSGSFFVISA
jgi:hypothetical protein